MTTKTSLFYGSVQVLLGADCCWCTFRCCFEVSQILIMLVVMNTLTIVIIDSLLHNAHCALHSPLLFWGCVLRLFFLAILVFLLTIPFIHLFYQHSPCRTSTSTPWPSTKCSTMERLDHPTKISTTCTLCKSLYFEWRNENDHLVPFAVLLTITIEAKFWNGPFKLHCCKRCQSWTCV